MPLQFVPLLVGLFLFAGMMVLLHLGLHFGRRRVHAAGGPIQGLGVVEGGIFALFGLLVALTFSGAASRFDGRKSLLVGEANALGTAYLRVDLLPEAEQPAVREAFRRYLDARLAVYAAIPDVKDALGALADVGPLQEELWLRVTEACRSSDVATRSLLIGAVNDCFDAASERTMAAFTHPPVAVHALLGALALVCAFLAGISMSTSPGRHWVHRLGFSAVTAVTVFLILELEYPRIGFIRLEKADQVLLDVRRNMD